MFSNVLYTEKVKSKSKDKLFFEDIYLTLSDPIFRFCLVRVRERHLALDITQDSFTKFWQYIQKEKYPDNPRAFLYKIANNLIIDHSRKNKSISLDMLLEEGVDFADETVTSKHWNLVEAQEAKTFLQSIPEKYKDPLIMRFVEDLTIDEISEVMNLSQNVISVRIHRGLKMLKEKLQDKE